MNVRDTFVRSATDKAKQDRKNEHQSAWVENLRQWGYVATDELATMVSLAHQLERPLLLEGPAGVGKTSLAAAVAKALHRPLVRLQCFEGLDAAGALYDWNYHKQLAHLSKEASAEQVFTAEYLLPRPLMQALLAEEGAVLLIDEIDRADEAFEALLLEFLAEYQITVPEWTTVVAKKAPMVFLTSNRTRALSDALRRRCLYDHLDWPVESVEMEVLSLRVPELSQVATAQIVRAIRTLRTWDLLKPPGVAESIDWAQACLVSTGGEWSEAFVRSTLGCVVKDAYDLDTVRARISELFSGDT